MKIRTYSNSAEAEELVESVRQSSALAIEAITAATRDTDPIDILWKMKFERFGYNPIDGHSPLNLIEQINQSFTYLATASALKLLFELHPEGGPFRVNLGTASGYDIENVKLPGVIAEVFAAVTPSNNQKLKRDIAKLQDAAAEYRYVFFLSPGFEIGRQVKLESREGIEVWSLGGRNAL